MLIKKCKGYELQKEKPNTSEDFFNRSEIVFEEDGIEKTVHVLYVRFFDELISEFTPYEKDPIFKAGSREVELKDIVALACLIKNPSFRHRKRVYINSKTEFTTCFQNLDFDKLPVIFEALESQKIYDLQSPLEFIIQPH